MKDQCFNSPAVADTTPGARHHAPGSRAQALAAGDLFDVSASAVLASFRVPVAVTSATWSVCVGQDAADSAIAERLWTVLFAAFGAIRRKERRTDRAAFVAHVMHEGRQGPPVELLAVVEPGDRAEPVITIYLSSEY